MSRRDVLQRAGLAVAAAAFSSGAGLSADGSALEPDAQSVEGNVGGTTAQPGGTLAPGQTNADLPVSEVVNAAQHVGIS